MNSSRRRLVFFWENLGPYHFDRLSALAAEPDLDVLGIQTSARSGTYDWSGGERDNVPVTTLFAEGEAVTRAATTRRLLAACRDADAVFLCHYELPQVLAAATVLRARGRTVFTMLVSKFDDYPRSAAREVGKSVFLKPYNGALCGTPRARDYIAFLGVDRDAIQLGYNTLSIERIRAQAPAPPAPAGVGHEDRDFVIVARLVPKKNLSFALDAYAAYRAAGGAPRRLVILGSGPLEAELRAQAARLGIADRVEFRGFVQTAEVSAALSRALCLILPSVEEQFGLVVIEAMAMGVPALLSTNAGAADVMIDNGVDGWLIDPVRPGALVAAMVRLSADEGEWHRAATAAAAGASRGDTPRFVEGVRALLAP